MTKKKINEGALTNFVSSFFDGVANNTTQRFLDKAKKKGMPKPVIDKMKQIDKERAELEKLIKSFGV
jgi:hypothetical protein